MKGITKICLRNKAFLDFEMKIRIGAYIIVAREALRKILKKFKFRKKFPCLSYYIKKYLKRGIKIKFNKRLEINFKFKFNFKFTLITFFDFFD
ncbi:hypothetical protein A0Z34_00910 [Campylobacter upsaliensis]|nr:hypothetical protein [Campylobacter upsaliensis]EAL3986497.1 hypothetical protein [Campylobacter upsaliensis]